VAGYDTIRDQIKTSLDSVADIGNVYDYQRLRTEMKGYLDLFQTEISSQKQIRGWIVTVEDWGTRSGSIGNGCIYRAYHFVVRGYQSIIDSIATEKTFLSLIELVDKQLVTDLRLLSSDYVLREYPVLRVFEPRLFGGVLCHYAEIDMIVEYKQDM
jgi:hypothetical protein